MIEYNNETGIAVQIGLAGVAEYSYLAEDNWLDIMNTQIEPIKHIPHCLHGYKQWQYIGVDGDVSCSVALQSIDKPYLYCQEADFSHFYPKDNVNYICAVMRGEPRNDISIELQKFPFGQHLVKSIPDGAYAGSFVQVMTLDQLLGNIWSQIDVLAVDIEGEEVSLFQNYRWHIKPKFIAVEFHGCFAQVTISDDEFVSLFEKQGYNLVLSKKTNCIDERNDPYTLELQFLL